MIKNWLINIAYLLGITLIFYGLSILIDYFINIIHQECVAIEQNIQVYRELNTDFNTFYKNRDVFKKWKINLPTKYFQYNHLQIKSVNVLNNQNLIS